MSYLQLWLIALLTVARETELHAEYLDSWVHEMYGCACTPGKVPTISN